jgi:hypothetical protein
LSRRLWSGIGLSKARKSEEKVQTWLPDASVKAAINRGEKLYRA